MNTQKEQTHGKKREPVTNVIPQQLRGTIKGKTPARSKERIGGDKTNADYAKEKGITSRQASKQRRGY